jgi:hypothetical protein
MPPEKIEHMLHRVLYGAGKALIVKCVSCFLIGLVLMIAINAALGKFHGDDTDGITRSNMRPHIDSRTGCQYLSVSGGGITPRKDHNGQHLGCKQNKIRQ